MIHCFYHSADLDGMCSYDTKTKADYAKTYAFETELQRPPIRLEELDRATARAYADSQLEFSGRPQSRPPYKAIAVNIGSPPLEMFEAMWDVKCPNCPPSLTSGGFIGCNQCKGTGYIQPYDLAIAFVRGNDKLWHVQLFSKRGDVDCGAIAYSFGGNGSIHEGEFDCVELPFEI